MRSQNRFIVLLGLTSYLMLCTGTALALHIWAEGPEHEHEPDDCPVCNQLTYGSVAQTDDPPKITCAPQAVHFSRLTACDQAFLPQFITLEDLAPRAPPTC